MVGKNDKWEWIKKTFPKVKEVIGDLLPDKGVIGIVKNIISNDTSKSKQERDEALKHLVSLEELYLKDVQQARDSETKRDTSKNSSWLSKNIHEILALMVVGGFMMLMWGVVFVVLFKFSVISLPELKLLLEIFGIKEIVSLILGYMYGRSRPQTQS